MSKRTAGLTALGVLCGLSISAAGVGLAAHSQIPLQYTSPDGRTVAVVGPVAGTKTDEGKIEIHDASGASRVKRSFASSDGEHGLVILRASWSPDSAFFVFSGSSSGGHQPWHSPMFLYSRADNIIYELDKCVRDIAVVDAEFQISSPDLLRVTIAPFVEGHGLGERVQQATYSLREVVRKCRSE
jgi:hypothetical protein